MRTMLCVVMVAGFAAGGAAQAVPAQPTAQSIPAPAPTGSSTQPGDPMLQMRDDLNRLESLNQNMSSEIEFLHDQNLQILLRTNSQMWTVLIRDLRRQLDREEQNRKMPQDGARGSGKPDQR